MIVAVELKKHMTDAYIFSIIVRKFGYRQESCLIVLLLINKNIKISLYSAILSLSLAVRL